MKVARLIKENVRPFYKHDCDQCVFLGRLDGKDLYVCNETNFIGRFGDKPRQYGCMVDHTPTGTTYSFAKQLKRKFGAAVSGNEAGKYMLAHAWRSIEVSHSEWMEK